MLSSEIVAELPEPPTEVDPATIGRQWARWQEGLSVRFTLPKALPPLRMLLVLDNLAGHKTPKFVLWLVGHGIMPLYTPLGASWLNMTESIQGILAWRALAGHHPQSPDRNRSRQRRHMLGRSGACSRRAVRRTKLEKWQQSCQVAQ
jgi:hypothetical protein